MKSPVHWMKLAPAIVATLVSPVIASAPTQAVIPTATTPHPLAESRFSATAIAQATPPDVGAPGRGGGGGTYFSPPTAPTVDTPGRSRGGARRGNCPNVPTPLTALVPFTEKAIARFDGGAMTSTNVWGLTTAAKPVFWFYVPYTTNKDFLTEFVLQTAEGDELYRKELTLPDKPGVLGVRLPSTVADLKPDQLYQWYVEVRCSRQAGAAPIYIQGWVQRTSAPQALVKQLAAAKPQERAALYAQNGIWYDALTTIADLRLAKPSEPTLLADWKTLLESVKLGDVADQPLVKS